MNNFFGIRHVLAIEVCSISLIVFFDPTETAA